MIFKQTMSKSSSMILFFIMIISLNHLIDSSYNYAGCFTQVFHESFFTSSFMEPTLCFRLCDTPIIYLQKTICRCSGGGLMHYNRQPDSYCSIRCTKPADRQAKTENTCGGLRTYSAYVEENFYIRHGHLFNYQINFFSCELWKDSDVYEKFSVKLNQTIIRSSLNKIELCAAECLDQNMTTKSIAFNDDNNQCLCIMPWKVNTVFQRTHYLTILPNTSCDRYCNNTSEDSKINNKFQCGSLTDPRIWAIYDLNGTCPTDFVYIQELKKCLYTYKGSWSSCALPSKSYVYDGSITWNSFLKIIDRLKLNEFLVSIDFDADIIVNSTWKCPSTSTDELNSYFSRSYSSYYGWNLTKSYILNNGCLLERSSSSYLYRYLYRLCITKPLNKYSSDDDENNSIYIINYIDPLIKFCPINWLDLNGRCYRMSDEPKTIQNAKDSCITISEKETNKNDKSHSWSNEYDDDADDDQLNDSPKGNIVQYTSEWQARLGFFLLDTVSENDVLSSESSTQSLNLYYEDLKSLLADVEIYHSSVYEFQMINPIENNNLTINNDTCIISTRTSNKEEERPIIKSISANNCSQTRYVLCETKTLIVQNFQQGCFHKPLILDLPALISNRLTYELCLTICQELQTKLVIIHINKCYCLNGFVSKTFNLTADLEKYQRKDCGNPCLGNQHEQCGNDDTIIVFHILYSRLTYNNVPTSAEPFPDFIYDSCINVNSFNSSTTYQFNLNHIHPRHCLELCTNRQQKYALINLNKCFCTNIPIKNDEYNTDILSNQQCSKHCSANYFYTCGNNASSTIYSMYIMQPKCRHGFEVAENDQQCVYSHFSIKKNSFSIAESYCKSIGGIIVKINDILEVQDILPESMLYTRYSKLFPLLILHFKSFNDTRYFWIDRTSNIPDNNTISDRLLEKCSQISENVDKNCLIIHHEKYSYDNITIYQQCIAESNQCSVQSAMPICIDQHLEPNSKFIPLNTDNISSKISLDYSCGNDTEYHFIDDYCYKILFHEISWNNAKTECERDNATLFVPEKSITLQIIKSLFLHQGSYTSSGFAHVGVIYDNQNRTVIQYNDNILQTIPDSNTIYDSCEKTFNERYITLMSSINERNRLKNQQIGCAYIDLLSYTVPVICCDEIPCNRTATVICQKLPNIKKDVIKAKREIVKIQTTPSGRSVDDQSTTTISESPQENTKSIGRDFAPIFFILAILFALILLGFISTLYNHRLFQQNNNNNNIFHRRRRNKNSVYSQLTSANEFDLN